MKKEYKVIAVIISIIAMLIGFYFIYFRRGVSCTGLNFVKITKSNNGLYYLMLFYHQTFGYNVSSVVRTNEDLITYKTIGTISQKQHDCAYYQIMKLGGFIE